MPLTLFQKEILLLLKENRNPNSYIAGGIAIHREASSMRTSNDIDLFHDTDEALSSSVNEDLSCLESAGFLIQVVLDQPSFCRAIISKEEQSVKLEWVRDTAFRFFPVVEDDELGYRLHDVDLMVNKCLALANRIEVRDIVDLIQQNKEVLSLEAACWAACGKDPGFTPDLLFDLMKRNSLIDPHQLQAEALRSPIDPVELKKEWLTLMGDAEKKIHKFPGEELGCIYLDEEGAVVKSPADGALDSYARHYGSVGGAWPHIVTER
ncbi:MAG: hypothetical protein KDD55_03740 [Bdellovibrionales bacterium]|nr:hypothetical protein [Bdellovibrionales bacterium]